MLTAWEIKILSDYPGYQPETEYEKHKAAEDMFFLKLAQKLRDEGRCAEAECRAMGCRHKCSVYLGRKCIHLGGKKIPTNTVRNVVNPGWVDL